MKKKDLKKIAIEISNQLTNINGIKKSTIREEEYRTEYDSEVSDKLKKLILNIIQYKENLRIDIAENYFTISTNDIKSIKKSNNSNKLVGDDNYLEIYVDKNGFSINRAYTKRSRYMDVEIFNELIPMIRQRNKEINSEYFNEIWEEVMFESGLMRDNNLDELGI